ncbi:Sulfotransferase family cytosolic 1B member 1 [Holothuria leucospilota]|uniref:Sulfotransferase family cytosolic 1B member 1 n=1 Tax=Holothuria leucospilota TaxID=206669 RepID=A0A9Q1BD74_HOLLE|nr:Sulfotransferase family cytosolic 1B member 1 [Holothuria leucospilota]
MRAAGPGLRRMKNKPSPRVLITHVPYALLPKGLYEKMCKNPLEAVKQIAAFLDKDLDNEALSRVVQHSSIEAMRKAYDQDHASSEKQEIEKNDFRFFIDRGI